MEKRIKAAICTDLRFRYETVYAGSIEEQIAAETDLYPRVLTTQDIRNGASHLEEIEVIFGTWGITAFTPEDLNRLPNLKAVFYAAGSVKPFAEHLFERGVRVCSAWQMNADPVAAFTLSHILLACKGYFRTVDALRQPDAVRWRGDCPTGPGIFEQRIGIIGCGAIGRRVLELLKPFDLIPVSMDSYPSLDMDRMRNIFSNCLVVSNHLANKAHLRGIYTADLFRRLPRGATFINTGRGAQVDHDDLVNVLKERPDLTAVLDVTNPEPPEMSSPLRSLPNVQLSAHISGSINWETRRMSLSMLEEFKRWRTGEALQHEVKAEDFALLA